jgi:predicted transcriptional regulator of viral defense system/predicted nucleotidyltransferase
MTKGIQSIPRSPLGRIEAQFISKVGSRSTFSSLDAREILGHSAEDPTRQFLERLQNKGWIKRIRRGRFAVIPLSSGEERTPQLHEFLVAMELVSPAAIAYSSALNHHGMTEQLSSTVFVATDHPVRRPPTEVLGIPFKVVSLRPHKFFGVVRDWINEKPFMVTDKEKTLIDGLDLPQYIGGVVEVAKALAGAWHGLHEAKLRDYAARMRNSAVAKRLGYLMETLQLGDPGALRKSVDLAPGFSLLDPTLPRKGKYNRRWGLLLNLEIEAGTIKVLKSGLRSRADYRARQTMHSQTDQILKELQIHRHAIRAYGVRSLGLFGSYAHGEQKRGSDLDFVVEFERKSFDAYMDLKAYLEKLLKRRVDLVISDMIKPRLRESVLKEALHVPGL